MIDKVLEERGSRYGTFADHAKIAQSLIEVIRNQPKWMEMKPDARQAVTVICDKIARMLNGDPEYDDNWVDIIGYATLVLNRMKAEQREVVLKEMVKNDEEMGLYDEPYPSYDDNDKQTCPIEKAELFSDVIPSAEEMAAQIKRATDQLKAAINTGGFSKDTLEKLRNDK